ncbi:homeobox domain-containing protein, partial [Mycotypha africana]|uniref:homeobox domain-containing protein n=1 Tax=Mycotypha africana TaxID=64632 RepID=UPI0023015B7F
SSNEEANINKKRTRVTPSQLTVLEETFNITATPDSKMRKHLAAKLQMPERSIQIWFQNRRAKVKMLQKRFLLRQEQEAARASNHQPFVSSLQHPATLSSSSTATTLSQPFPYEATATTNNNGHGSNASDNSSSLLMTGSNGLSDMTVSPSPTPQPFVSKKMEKGCITATAVTIGSWHRMKIDQQDLTCSYNNKTRNFSWHIRDNNYHFKMMISFDSVQSIELNVLEDNISAQVDIDVSEPPQFFMEKINPTTTTTATTMNNNENAQGWVQCSDFTEGMQASIVLRHTIRGLATDLRHDLLTIAGVDDRLCQITRFP